MDIIDDDDDLSLPSYKLCFWLLWEFLRFFFLVCLIRGTPSVP